MEGAVFPLPPFLFSGIITEQTGAETRSYDLWNQKYEGHAQFGWKDIQKDPYLKELIGDLEKQAEANNWRSALGWIKEMREHPDRSFYFHWHRDRRGRFTLAHVRRGSDKEDIDLLRQTGQLTVKLKGGEIQRVAGYMEKAGDYTKISGVLNEPQVEQLRQALLNSGNTDAAEKVKELYLSLKGKQNSFHFDMELGKDGSLARLKLGNEVIVDRMRAYRDEDLVRVKSETDVMPYHSTPDTAWEFLQGNELVAERYMEQAKNYGTRALQYQAVQEAKAVEQFLRHQGIITTDSSVSGSGTLRLNPAREAAEAAAGLPGALGEWALEKLLDVKPEVRGDLSLSRANMEKFIHDLFYYQFRHIQEHALRASQIGGKIDWELFKKTYERNAHEFWRQMSALAEGKSPSEFGASSIIGEPIAALRRYLKEAKGNLSEAYSRWKEDMERRYGEELETPAGTSSAPSQQRQEHGVGTPEKPLDVTPFAGKLGMKSEEPQKQVSEAPSETQVKGESTGNKQPVEAQRPGNVVDMSAYADKLGMGKPKVKDNQ